MVNLTIDGKAIRANEGTTILDAARNNGIDIPTLCYLKDLNEIGACRVCCVEIEGHEKLSMACNTKISEGMVIHTNSRRARLSRRTNVELILSEHDSNCAVCLRCGNCQLQKLAVDLNIHRAPYGKMLSNLKGNTKFPLIRDYTRCIKCWRCVQVCDKVQDSHIWDIVNLGHIVRVDVANAYSLEESNCALCGQCITHCPVGALAARDDSEKLMDAIEDPDKITLVQIAPSIRTAWGEEFGMTPDKATVKRLAACLKRLGVDYVFDTDFSADLTIMEEATEFVRRYTSGELKDKPMFTSCCPGWVRYCKAKYPDFIDSLSTAKSPQQMFGAVAKSYYAEIMGIDPEKIYSVSIMPCVAKKHECAIPVMNDAGAGQDVDIALTTREIVRLLKQAHIDPSRMEEMDLDVPLGIGSGAGAIFGVTGGVMEAALRTAYKLVAGVNPKADAFKRVRGMDGWKEAEFSLADVDLKVAVANGLGNAGRLLDAIRAGRVHYDFVEIMACPGGCVGGGGQPIHNNREMAPHRAPVLYNIDATTDLRFSHENPSIIEIYDKYLGEPGSERAEELLHTDHHAWLMPNGQ